VETTSRGAAEAASVMARNAETAQWGVFMELTFETNRIHIRFQADENSFYHRAYQFSPPGSGIALWVDSATFPP
jgi:hypothetical protein